MAYASAERPRAPPASIPVPRYTECYSKAKGSARLRRVPPSLTPPPRATSALSTLDSTKKTILDHFKAACPTSPSTRDVMRRHVGPFVVQEKVPAYLPLAITFLSSCVPAFACGHAAAAEYLGVEVGVGTPNALGSFLPQHYIRLFSPVQ